MHLFYALARVYIPYRTFFIFFCGLNSKPGIRHSYISRDKQNIQPHHKGFACHGYFEFGEKFFEFSKKGYKVEKAPVVMTGACAITIEE
jgi:hypothetical protein